MIPVANQLPCDGPTLEAVVQKAFSQRRKVIRNCLSGMFTEEQIIAAGIKPTDRPEAVGLAEYVALANLLK
jgi:16S rRNA (adenine1518-N6/adenine1519-N6)-dimethyltransferase